MGDGAKLWNGAVKLLQISAEGLNKFSASLSENLSENYFSSRRFTQSSTSQGYAECLNKFSANLSEILRGNQREPLFRQIS